MSSNIRWRDNIKFEISLKKAYSCLKIAAKKEGERVVIQPHFPCTACPVCLSGRGNICPRKVRLTVSQTVRRLFLFDKLQPRLYSGAESGKAVSPEEKGRRR
ncbi:MAG: hypothetical protein A2Z43_09105 [Syntrophobacterales bacterium RBG_19FT_COMBO_59_10]|nr:MAG: hypothetical protein A2Z43_09105 [Syntrophobacterales bacterium RBG_19FT_COMBO_59_10]